VKVVCCFRETVACIQESVPVSHDQLKSTDWKQKEERCWISNNIKCHNVRCKECEFVFRTEQ
jgi:hypothetical protein